MAGTRDPQISKVPSGTKEPFCRPSRDFSIWLTPDPAINGWAIVIASLRDWQTPNAPIIHLKMTTGKKPFKCGMGKSADDADCTDFFPLICVIREICG
jgi:hypothetical protein